MLFFLICFCKLCLNRNYRFLSLGFKKYLHIITQKNHSDFTFVILLLLFIITFFINLCPSLVISSHTPNSLLVNTAIT